jgi:hypothetical protein
VALVRTDVSEEHIVSVIRVKKRSLILSKLMMEATRPFDTSVLIKATRRHISEDGILRLI